MIENGEARTDMDGIEYRAHMEAFEQVCLPENVQIRDAKPEDFHRVVLTVKSILEARMTPPPAGYWLYEVVKPGTPTEGERMARQRILNGQSVDKTKI